MELKTQNLSNYLKFKFKIEIEFSLQTISANFVMLTSVIYSQKL